MSKSNIWLKRLGIIGFVLFLLKGILWIAVFLGIGNLIVGLFK